jgi:dihydrodipicolinate synthase/N-acetylneuraminate lyase
MGGSPASGTSLTADRDVRAMLRRGGVIPAHPLALTDELRLDEQRQRALTRYYLAAGAHGIAVGVHTTQFEIHDPSSGLLGPVLELAAEVAAGEDGAAHPLLIAGACGPTQQAMTEAEVAVSFGYDAVLLSPIVAGASEDDLLERAREVAEVAPVIGFYLQTAIGGPELSLEFWRSFAAIPDVVAVKIAPFHRYRSLDVVRAVAEVGRADEIALYTGNDDTIVTDLITPFSFAGPSGTVTQYMAGGLLGQWATWTREAVRMFDLVGRARAGDAAALASLVSRAAAWTDVNSAVFDARNNFAGTIAGVHEVLRRQGLLESIRCLDPAQVLSLGQSEELDRVIATHPWLLEEDAFITEHLAGWLG